MDITLFNSLGATAPGNGSPPTRTDSTPTDIDSLPTDTDDNDNDDNNDDSGDGDKGGRSDGASYNNNRLSGLAIMCIVQGLIWALIVTK